MKIEIQICEETRVACLAALLAGTILGIVALCWHYNNENDRDAFAAGYTRSSIAGERGTHWTKP